MPDFNNLLVSNDYDINSVTLDKMVKLFRAVIFIKLINSNFNGCQEIKEIVSQVSRDIKTLLETENLDYKITSQLKLRKNIVKGKDTGTSFADTPSAMGQEELESIRSSTLSKSAIKKAQQMEMMKASKAKREAEAFTKKQAEKAAKAFVGKIQEEEKEAKEKAKQDQIQREVDEEITKIQ
jgi:hypothetical protein